MSPDQVNNTYWATVLQTVAVWLQTLIGGIAIYLAIQEFRKSREDQIAAKKIDKQEDRKFELAMRLGRTATAIRDAFRSARSPFSAGHAPIYKPNSTPQEKSKQDEEYDYNQRLDRIADKLDQLYEIRWEISVLFSENEHIDEQVKAYNAKFSELRNAIYAVFESKQTLKDDAIVWAGFDGKDDFGDAVEVITKELLALAYKYAR